MSDLDQGRGFLNTALWLVRASLRASAGDPSRYFHANKTFVRWERPCWFERERLEVAALRDPESWRTARELYQGDFLEGDYGQWALAETSSSRERV